MKQQPLVSVLMPVYNGEKYLAEAIDSILQQTYTHFELLVINDGSTDASEQIILSYNDARIRYVQNEQNSGLIFTLNKGIDLAAGQYIARMDADDVCMPNRLALQVAFLEQNPQVGMCGASAYRMDAEGKILGKMGKICDSALLRASLLFSSPYIHPLMMIRTSLLQANKYNADYKHVEDFELWTRLAEQTEGANLPDYLLRYRWHDSNVSVVYNEVQLSRNKELVRAALLKLGIEMTDAQYATHISSFGAEKVDFDALLTWFTLLIQQNKVHQRYSHDALVALLYSRWILSAIRQKQYNQVFRWKWYSCKALRLTLHIFKHKR